MNILEMIEVTNKIVPSVINIDLTCTNIILER